VHFTRGKISPRVHEAMRLQAAAAGKSLELGALGMEEGGEEEPAFTAGRPWVKKSPGRGDGGGCTRGA